LIMKILVALLLGLGIAFWAISEQGPEVEAEPEPVEVPYLEGFSEPKIALEGLALMRENQGQPPAAISEPEIDSATIAAGVAECMKTDDPISCMLANPDLVADTETFAVLLASAASRQDAKILASVFLLKSDPVEVFEKYSSLYEKARNANRMIDDMVLESGFKGACKYDPAWQLAVAQQLSSTSIYGPGLTDIGVVMAGNLARLGQPDSAEVLRSGFQGTIPATEAQKSRAVGWLVSLGADSFTKHQELSRIYHSLPSDALPDVPQTLAAMLLRPPTFPNGDPQPNIQIVDQLLSNPKWGPDVARQIVASFSYSGPRNLTADQWATVQRGIDQWE
jgi:hypothetical protein